MTTTITSSDELQEAWALVRTLEQRGLPVPPELEYEVMVREQVRRGLFPWPSFRSYVEYMNPSLLRFEHANLLVNAAERVASGEIVNLMVLLPPRYLKTTTFGELLGSYMLAKHPYRSVGLASYNASRARQVSVGARDYFERTGKRLKPGQEAKSFWGPPEGGLYWAVGVVEGTLGRGMHLGICDDPIDPEKARSSAYQQRFISWWPDKWLSRREPGAGAQLVLVMQRLGVEDPVGYLFRCEVGERTEKRPLNWHVLVCDEIKGNEPLGHWDGPQGLPPTCTLLEDRRAVGEVLSPSFVSAQEVRRIHQETASTTVAAQRQQRPMRPSGDFWRKDWFRTYRELPPQAFDGGRDWDTAYGGDPSEAAASAWVRSFRGPGPDGEFPIYIDDAAWDWLEFPALVEWMKSLAGPHYVEKKATGKSTVQVLKTYEVVADEVGVVGDKLARASAAQPAVASGRVYVREDVLDTILYGEGQGLLRITADALADGRGGLDLNDAFVQAIWRQLKLGGPEKKKGFQVVWA